MLRLAPFVLLALALVACDRDTPTKPIASAPAGKMVATVDAPAEPTNLRVETITDTSARVAWDAVEGATDYDVNYRTLSGRWTNEPHKGTRLYNTIYDLEPNTEYRWAVRAENSDGPSDWVFAENFTTLEATESSVTSANLELGGSVEGDREALEAVYHALISHKDPPRGWLTRIRLAKWDCVETNEHGRVVSLALPCREGGGYRGNWPAGELPPELGQLTHLRHLYIKGEIDGQLPPEIGQLTQLEFFELNAYPSNPTASPVDGDHILTGGLPDEWANLSNLHVLRINSRGHLGTDPSLYDDPETDWGDPYHPFPAWLGQLSSLEVLDLSSNAFAGPIPAELGQLANLKVFKRTGFPGPLPPELGQLSQLDTLWLHAVRSGSIPPEWGGMTSLRVLYLTGIHEQYVEEGAPRLGDRIPTTLGNLTKLEHLTLANADWEGPLPASLGQLEKLKGLWIYTEGSGSYLSGRLPPEWSGMKSLERLAIRWQELEGPLPEEWAFMQKLEYLDLRDNFIEGPLPELWGQFKALKELNLDNNFIDSPLPVGWSNMESLETLTIVESGINGELPPEWSNLSNLKGLNLEHNEITGTIPSSWVQMESLEWLNLDYNNLSGIFPSLRGMKNLRALGLSGQNFTNKVGCSARGGAGFSPDLLPSQMLKTYTDRHGTFWRIPVQGMYFCPRAGWSNDDSGSDYSLGD